MSSIIVDSAAEFDIRDTAAALADRFQTQVAR